MDMEGIQVKRSKDWDCANAIKVGRQIGLELENRKEEIQKGTEGDNIQHIFEWIQEGKFGCRSYHVLKSNCHYLALQVFETVTETVRRVGCFTSGNFRPKV